MTYKLTDLCLCAKLQYCRIKKHVRSSARHTHHNDNTVHIRHKNGDAIGIPSVIHTLDIMYNAAAGNADTSCSP